MKNAKRVRLNAPVDERAVNSGLRGFDMVSHTFPAALNTRVAIAMMKPSARSISMAP